MSTRVAIVGPGRAGLTLGYALAQAEAVGSLVYYGRRPEPPAHPLFIQGSAEYVFGLAPLPQDTQALFLAVPDRVVPDLAQAVAAQGDAPRGCAAFHLSGALSTEVLGPLHARGYSVGSFHPLQAIAHPVTSAERLPGSYVALTGEPGALGVGRRLCSDLGCPTLSVPETWRPLYHAAAVLASNFLPPLLDAAARILERAGVDHDDALPALLPLVRGTLANIEEVGVEAAITGPVARGDVETVALHLRALEGGDRRLYAFMARELTRLMDERIDEDTRQELAARLTEEIDA